LLLAGVIQACGDHLLSHLSEITDHLLGLTENLADSYPATRTQILRFHALFFSAFSPAMLPSETTERMLRYCCQRIVPLLEQRSPTASHQLNGGGGNRGKKRARGAEDGLVAGLEGRAVRGLGADEADEIELALELISTLLSSPLVSRRYVDLIIGMVLQISISPLPPFEHTALAGRVQARLDQLSRHMLVIQHPAVRQWHPRIIALAVSYELLCWSLGVGRGH
jgi:hypothetical protein